MIKRFTLLTLLVGSSLLAQAQAYLKESNNWYFGTNAGLVFYPNILTGGGNPASIDSAQFLEAFEGTAAMSDTSGRLLFYVGTHEADNGLFNAQSSVFNRRHQTMPGGRNSIIGGSSSSQNALVIRKPGSFRYYYIFSVAQQENEPADGQGFYYTLIDMQKDNGLGDVVDSVHNRVILPTATEKVTAVLHRDGHRVWVIGHENGTNRFAAVLLSDTGVSAPVFTSIGRSHGTGTNARTNLRGCMKLSPNGNRIAVAITEPLGNWYYMQVFRFNNLTGALSDGITFRYASNGGFGPYGVEFSPDNSKVYFSDRSGGNKIFQYDLCAGTGDSADIVASKYSISTNFQPMCLQLGLNGKVYISQTGNKICYINNPNAAGSACQYNATGITLQPGTSADRGLTNVNQSIFNSLNPKIEYVKVCENDITEFAAQAECQGVVATYTWDFGDPNSGVSNNTSNEQFPRHHYTAPGVYNVRVAIDAGNIVDTGRVTLTITPRPRGSIFGDQVACRVLSQYNYIQDTLNPDLSPDITQYFWRLVGSTTDTSYQGAALNQILYPFDSNQTVEVRAVAYSTNELGEKCPSDTARLSVIVNQRKGATPVGLDTVCMDQTIPYVLTSTDSPRSRYRWVLAPANSGIDHTTGDTTNTYSIFFNKPGKRTVRVDGYKDFANQICYVASDPFSFYIAASPSDSIQVFGDSSICTQNNQLFLAYGGQPGSTYRWAFDQPAGHNDLNFLSTDLTADTVRIGFNVGSMKEGDGLYVVKSVEVSRDGCLGKPTFHPIYNNCVNVPNLVTPNNDQMNDDFYVTNASRYNDNELELYNRWGRTVFKKTGFSNDLASSELQPGTYFYRFRVNVEGVNKEFKGWMEVVK